jgi:hypothetical protein
LECFEDLAADFGMELMGDLLCNPFVDYVQFGEYVFCMPDTA